MWCDHYKTVYIPSCPGRFQVHHENATDRKKLSYLLASGNSRKRRQSGTGTQAIVFLRQVEQTKDGPRVSDSRITFLHSFCWKVDPVTRFVLRNLSCLVVHTHSNYILLLLFRGKRFVYCRPSVSMVV